MSLKTSISNAEGNSKIRNTDQPAVRLPNVHAAAYDSGDDQHLSFCQDGTRVELLKEVTGWIYGSHEETILWINGPAGIGKSTVSRTVAHMCDGMGVLGASYFFRRGEDARSDPLRIIPTLATQLAATVPGFGKALRKSLDDPRNEGIESKNIKKQSEALLLTPTRGAIKANSTTTSSRPMLTVIVIDALDECEGDPGVHQGLLKALATLGSIDGVRFRVVLTSREAHEVDAAINQDIPQRAWRALPLHKKFQEQTEVDISRFFEAQFERIARKKNIRETWPSASDLERVIELANTPSPLFIYAATLCRYIYKGDGRKNPKRLLHDWLRQVDNNASQLDQIYMPILDYVFFGRHKDTDEPDPLNEEEQLQLRQLLSALVILGTPLTPQAISDLLEIPLDDTDHYLCNLHAVVHLPEDPDMPVRLFHQSFRDFLVAEGKGREFFHVDEREANRWLAQDCLRVMRSLLKQDICNIKDPGILRHEIADEAVENHIPQHLRYACCFWLHHETILHVAEVREFVYTHLLHWIECLAILGKYRDCLELLEHLLDKCRVSAQLVYLKRKRMRCRLFFFLIPF